MSQGKEWDKEGVVRTLEPFFKLGCNIKKACDYAGIPYTTVHTWISDDEELRIKVTGWQNEVNNEARKVLAGAIKQGNTSIALEWLKKKEKDEFSDRTELTGADGKDLPTPLLANVRTNDGASEDTGAEKKN